ncbi:MAG: SMP-30/gluconolactonase/LRE family protein [Chloroflexota bacterium]
MRPGVVHWPMRAALLALALSLAVPCQPAGQAQKKAQTTVAGTTAELVWPLPPAPPRVRWVGQVTDLDEVKGKTKKKRSWIDRVAGAKATDEPDERLGRPYGIAGDSQGRLYVADGFQRQVFVLDLIQRRVEVRGSAGQASLALPVGVALDEKDRLFVSDSFQRSITCFDPSGRVLSQFGQDQLERPGGIAIDRQRQRLYVADAKAHRVAVFNTESFTFERYVGSPSTPGVAEPGRFSAPTNVAVDAQGNLYVADTWNHRVQVFDRRGRLLRAFGTHGTRPGSFVRPKGIAVDSEGHVYVADAEFNNFQIFTPDGVPLLAVGNLGNGPGQFTLIAGLYIDSQNRIYTTEQEGGRVQIFQYLSQPNAAAGKEAEQPKN